MQRLLQRLEFSQQPRHAHVHKR